MSQGSGEYIPLGRVPVLKVWIGFNCQSLYIFVPRSFFPFKRCFCLPCFFLVCERCKTSPTKILIRMGTPISNMDLPKGTLEMLHEKSYPSCQLFQVQNGIPHLLVRLYGWGISRDPGASRQTFGTPQTSRDGSYDEMYSWRMARDPLKFFFVNGD